jgi:hypothetical protein
VQAVRALERRQLARLFDAAESNPKTTLDDFVPDGVPALEQVIHEGKNSLPAFTTFQKRFCRPEPGAREIWGYNHQEFLWATGPGYFIGREEEGLGVVLDYQIVPPRTPPGWPRVRTNTGLAGLAYGSTRDVMRKLGTHVTIGRLYRYGKPVPNWFALVRS